MAAAFQPTAPARHAAPPVRPLTLQRVTLILSAPGLPLRLTACRVAGNRYVLAFTRDGQRPRFVVVPRAALAVVLRNGVRIVGRI
jgi:hypothetical protein